MFTRDNFEVLGQIRPPLSLSDRVKLVITLQYKSVRRFAMLQGVSITAISLWLRAPDLYPNVHQKIIAELGFDPFKTREHDDSMEQQQVGGFAEVCDDL
jgi:hypothetical protein